MSGDDWAVRQRRLTGQGAPIREQEFLDWKQWGNNTSITFDFPDDATRVLRFQQVVQAKFHHPVGWLVALAISATPGGTAGPDIANFFATITYGLGQATFVQQVSAGSISPLTPQPQIVVIGPTPAETILVEAFASVTPSGLLFPKQSVFRFGAFCSPQVWQ